MCVRTRVADTKCEVISLHRANRVNFATHRLNAAAGGVVEATVYRSYRFAWIDLTVAFHLCMPIEIGRPSDARNHLSKSHRCGSLDRRTRIASRPIESPARILLCHEIVIKTVTRSIPPSPDSSFLLPIYFPPAASILLFSDLAGICSRKPVNFHGEIDAREKAAVRRQRHKVRDFSALAKDRGRGWYRGI